MDGEGNGNPLQCSCLGNPSDVGAWWAAVYGVTQSRIRPMRLSSSSSNGLLKQILVLELSWKEIQPVHSEGDQPWDFFGRNDAKAETPLLWLPHEKS